MKEFHVLNLGAGVQSTALYLMIMRGELDITLDCAVFSDLGEEPKSVYDHLDYLIGLGGPPIRITRRHGDPYCKSYLTVEEARAHIADACRATGVPASTYYVGEMISREVDAKRPFQGEVFLSPAGITLNYTTEPGPMRIAMAAGMKHAEGLEARMLLVANLDATAYDRIMAMLEEYDEVVDGHGSTASHVVEFSMFQDAVGDDPWTRCVVWEVRGPY